MQQGDIEKQLEQMRKLGSVRSSEWQSYTWKNELAEQKRRIGMHLDEALTDAETEHNPYHMLERAIGIAAVSPPGGQLPMPIDQADQDGVGVTAVLLAPLPRNRTSSDRASQIFGDKRK
ncbi:hypothetical protein IE4872_PA00023 (plasmid) [Rhizobium gallicum]|uniref:Uncharacterized protein n=1 Tax=Rhizobium gallicum TaxID=56730 RepID=A0A1L5NPG3_9HYPH|nr:hypothetical protein [Rhizobium gallicum]APO69772.1 hypothetical protein IE4872_PA00023 [Rhizobium gallicum]